MAVKTRRSSATAIPAATAAALLMVSLTAAGPAKSDDWVLGTREGQKLPGCSFTGPARELVSLGPAKVGPPKFRDATFRKFRKKIGPPAKATKTSPSTLRAKWRGRKAARLEFLSFGGTTVKGDLLLQYGQLTGRRWVTERGVRVGTPLAEVKRVYGPPARKLPSDSTRTGKWWRLTAFCSPFGSGGETGSIEARIKRGRVAALSIWVGAAGD